MSPVRSRRAHGLSGGQQTQQSVMFKESGEIFRVTLQMYQQKGFFSWMDNRYVPSLVWWRQPPDG